MVGEKYSGKEDFKDLSPDWSSKDINPSADKIYLEGQHLNFPKEKEALRKEILEYDHGNLIPSIRELNPKKYFFGLISILPKKGKSIENITLGEAEDLSRILDPEEFFQLVKKYPSVSKKYSDYVKLDPCRYPKGANCGCETC